ncbi:MAG TPA: hypothetical protein VNL36_07305 [Bacteroidota bacterium]|nr:hypothetical protein [Bacteroidota bacterium]
MKPVSDQLFTLENDGTPEASWERCLAKDLGLAESWLRDQIFKNPELVIGPCRAAGITDDDWYAWQREYNVADAGRIDVLLLSSQGRVGVVETKLAYNPEKRRQVLAQALDYLAHLPEQFDESMPRIPTDENGMPVAEAEEVREAVAEGDVLVIIASDETDPKVVKLSGRIFPDNLVKQWDLALVDVALYRALSDHSSGYLIVPHLRNFVRSEPRQVVRVVVQGETPSARVEVERIAPDESTSARQKWDEKRFFENLESGRAPNAVRRLASQLRDLVGRFPDSLSLAYGTGKDGSVVLKRRNGGLIEVYGSGRIRFRPSLFGRALGEKVGTAYRRRLETIAPEALRMHYPQLPPEAAGRVAPVLFEAICQAVEAAEDETAVGGGLWSNTTRKVKG